MLGHSPAFTTYLGNEGLCSIIEDSKGKMWFTTFGNGVCRYDGKSFMNFTTKDGLVNNSVFSVLEGKTFPTGFVYHARPIVVRGEQRQSAALATGFRPAHTRLTCWDRRRLPRVSVFRGP